MKRFLKEKFPGLIRIYNRIYNHLYHVPFYGKDRAHVFARIYSKNHWRNTESISGPGSTLVKTENIRNELPLIFKTYSIQTMIDIPCGDFNWMKHVDLTGVEYTGLDIVPELIQHNVKEYSKNQLDFQVADLATSALGAVDLIFCRDCFVHLSYSHIKKSIMNIKASGAKYLLTTTFTKHSNFDIVTGNWRQINLQSAPFDFPDPIQIIRENDVRENEDKSMGLWKIEGLPDF